MKVRTDPVLEAIAKKLIGFSSVPMDEQVRMIHRAAKAAKGAADESIRREVIEECAKIIEQHERKRFDHAGYPMAGSFVPYWANELRALSDPLPESRSVVPDAKRESRGIESNEEDG